MKNKIYLAFVLFLAFQFFTTTKASLAQSCGAGGACVQSSHASVACVNGSSIGFDITSCCVPDASIPNKCQSGQYVICCKADDTAKTCVENGGSCKEGASCGSGFTPSAGIGCRTAQVCCKQDAGAPSGGNTIKFESPLRFTTVETLLAAVLNTFRGVVVVLSMIFFIYGAIVYITSAGSDDRIKSGKNAMSASLIGLALGIAAPSILKTIAEVLDWKGASAELTSAPSATAIGLKILSFLLGIVGILGMIMLVSGGIMYFAAGANEKSVETAKGIVKYAVIGIALALGAMVIIRQISALLT